MAKLTHVDERGDARMVEVGDKPVSRREATAEGWVALSSEALAAVVERTAKKGDVLGVAQVAGIQAAKRTADWIPLCHPLPLTGIDVRLAVDGPRVRCEATVRTEARTGVEMEALTAVSAALLTVYDMLKAVDRRMEVGPIRLVRKTKEPVT